MHDYRRLNLTQCMETHAFNLLLLKMDITGSAFKQKKCKISSIPSITASSLIYMHNVYVMYLHIIHIHDYVIFYCVVYC